MPYLRAPAAPPLWLLPVDQPTPAGTPTEHRSPQTNGNRKRLRAKAGARQPRRRPVPWRPLCGVSARGGWRPACGRTPWRCGAWGAQLRKQHTSAHLLGANCQKRPVQRPSDHPQALGASCPPAPAGTRPTPRQLLPPPLRASPAPHPRAARRTRGKTAAAQRRPPTPPSADRRHNCRNAGRNSAPPRAVPRSEGSGRGNPTCLGAPRASAPCFSKGTALGSSRSRPAHLVR
mmetsp:Transcript_130745/g.326213  ORF Transcript_130745/g.326213 Transcript_130745/m.326213 type:complete len:232 (+) Transcript_130745:171-866(+)